MASAPWASNPWLWVVSFRRLDEAAAPPLADLGAKERPILFRGSMVRAILAGRKTQTRRVVKGNPAGCFPMKGADNRPNGTFFVSRPDSDRVGSSGVRCPYGQPGDRLWVRETWRTWERPGDGLDGVRFAADATFRPIFNTKAAADLWFEQHTNPSSARGTKWRPSIHMPRWACRLVLEVTDVRVERLQDISEEDAKAEGADPWKLPMDVMHRTPGPEAYRRAFRSLWESIHG